MHTTSVWRSAVTVGSALLVGLIPGWGCSNDDDVDSGPSSLKTLDVAQLNRDPIDCDGLSGSIRAWLRNPDRVRVSTERNGDTAQIPSDYDRIDGMALFVVVNTVADFDNSTGLACGEQAGFWDDTATAVSGELPGVGDEFREDDPPSTAARFWTANYPDALVAVRSFRE